MDPSLLGYARFHGIASDYAAADPLSHIDDTFKADPGDDALLQHIKSECNNRLHTARVTLEGRLRGEKLSVSRGSARFLTSLICEAQAKNLINWDGILPNFHHIDDAKIDLPIFCLEQDSDVRLSKSPLRYLAHEIDLQLSDGYHEIVDVPKPLVRLRANESPLMEQIKKDKLRCSKGSLSLIQSVRSDAGPSVKELEDVLGSVLRTGHLEIESPVLLPLSTDNVPPSPTPVPDEHMLPSPVSSASIALDLYCRHPVPCELGPEDAIKERPISFTPTRESRHEPMVSTEGDNPSHGTSKLESEPAIEASFSFTEFYNKEKGSMIEVRSRQTSLSADKISNPLGKSGTCNLPQTNKSNDEISRHVATAVTEQRTQKSKTSPCHGPTSGCLHGAHGTERGIGSNQLVADLKPLRVNLGSLSSFMETRGRGPRRQIPAKSHCFASKEAQDSRQHISFTNPYGSEHQQRADVSAPKSTPIPPKSTPIPVVQVPRFPTQHEGLVLFVSTALLKTHLRVVQCLEGSEHPPKLIYRDYPDGPSKFQLNPQSKASTSQHPQTIPIAPPGEADIILSPRTGIILATSQATMQLHLPGYKSNSIHPNTPKVKAVNSPLRESIFRLSSRYEQLYVFISHGSEQSKRSKSRVSNPQTSADKHLLTSLTSLTTFCTSLSKYTNVIPLVVPSIPEYITAWILALAHKHACQLPPPTSQSLDQYRIAFTPANPKPQLGVLLGIPGESVWELFLRRIGLNPYAAQAILAVLRENVEVMNDGADYEPGARGGVGCLSKFVEMPSEEKGVLFRRILGEKILKRVDFLIKSDWQCDWALNS